MKNFIKTVTLTSIFLSIIFWSNLYAKQPDTFNVKVSPDFFWTFDDVDFSVAAIKNNKTMTDYEWYINISLTDSKWFILKPSEFTLADNWRWSISLEDKWSKLYKKWLQIRKWWNYKICVNDFSNENISWCSNILVYDKATNEWAITMLNKYWITIHKTRNDFKPNNSIRRDEAAKMIVSAIPYMKIDNQAKTSKNKCKFNDIDQAWTDTQRAVRESCKLGLFNWSNNLFRPMDTITNAQLVTVIWRIIYGKLDESWELYAMPYKQKLKNEGYLTNINITDNNLESAAKRGTLAKLLATLM